jgi:ketosteroid isomerase-like protein
MNNGWGRTLPLVAVLLLGCTGSGMTSAQPRRLDAQQEAALAETIFAVTERYNAAWEALSAESILAFHPDDLRYYYRGSGGISSRAVFERILRDEILPSMRSWSMKVIDPHVKVLGPDAATVSFVFDTEVVDASGQPDDYGSGALTYVFERRDGEWQIILIHESAPVPQGP